MLQGMVPMLLPDDMHRLAFQGDNLIRYAVALMTDQPFAKVSGNLLEKLATFGSRECLKAVSMGLLRDAGEGPPPTLWGFQSHGRSKSETFEAMLGLSVHLLGVNRTLHNIQQIFRLWLRYRGQSYQTLSEGLVAECAHDAKLKAVRDDFVWLSQILRTSGCLFPEFVGDLWIDCLSQRDQIKLEKRRKSFRGSMVLRAVV